MRSRPRQWHTIALPALPLRHPLPSQKSTSDSNSRVSSRENLFAHAFLLQNASVSQSFEYIRNFPHTSEIHTKMDFAHGPSKSRINPVPISRRRKFRRWLFGSAVCLLLIGLFYAEENWRGRRDWENCKRALKTQGIALNWTNYIPGPVPENQNIFGVPEMVTWFHGGNGGGWSDLARRLPSPTYPGFNIDTNTVRMPVAEITIGLPGTPAPDGSAVLRWNDPTSRTEAARLLTNAIGPTARAQQSLIGLGLMLNRPSEVQLVRIFMHSQIAPTEKALQEFLPDSILHTYAGPPERVLRSAPSGTASFRVTMPALASVADYLAWCDRLEPQLAVIRRALKRPYSQMHGFYANPNTVPGPNFRSVRNLMQTLGARAQCHLLRGEPEDALDDLTLMHDFCRRILAEQKPATLLSAMVNQAVRGLYAAQIGEGLRFQVWREPQLTALQEQLKTADVFLAVKEAFTMRAVITYRALESVPSAGMMKRTFLAGLYPRGWGYQHVAARVRLDFSRLSCFDTADQVILADKVDASDKQAHALDSGAYTFTTSLGRENFVRACQLTAHS